MLNMHFLSYKSFGGKRQKIYLCILIAYHGVHIARIKVTREGRLSMSISSQLPPAFAFIATAINNYSFKQEPKERVQCCHLRASG